MRLLAPILVMLCFLLTAPGRAQTSEGVRLEVTVALQAGVEAWNQGDLDRFMTGYLRSPDLIFTAGGRIIRGYDALQKRYQDTYGSSKSSMGQLRFEDIEVWPLGAENALAVGKWYLLLPGKGVGEQINGVFSLVLKKTPEGWKILHDHTSRLEEAKPEGARKGNRP